MGTGFFQRDGNNYIDDDNAFDSAHRVCQRKDNLERILRSYSGSWRIFAFISHLEEMGVSVPKELNPIVFKTWNMIREKKLAKDLGFKKDKDYGDKTFGEYFPKYNPMSVLDLILNELQEG